MTFDWDTIERAGIEAALGAVNRGLDLITARAKDKAPVRKLFKGQISTTRLKSISAIEADRQLRRQLGLGAENAIVQPPLTVTRRAPRFLHLRSAASIDVASLTRAGRYEVKSGRALDEGEVGGRLRREIEAIHAKLEGKVIRGRVISPTPYAIHQEMGNRHNPAHPYLRPAGHESRAEIVADIGSSVATAARAAARQRGRDVIPVQLKAVVS